MKFDVGNVKTVVRIRDTNIIWFLPNDFGIMVRSEEDLLQEMFEIINKLLTEEEKYEICYWLEEADFNKDMLELDNIPEDQIVKDEINPEYRGYVSLGKMEE